MSGNFTDTTCQHSTCMGFGFFLQLEEVQHYRPTLRKRSSERPCQGAYFVTGLTDIENPSAHIMHISSPCTSILTSCRSCAYCIKHMLHHRGHLQLLEGLVVFAIRQLGVHFILTQPLGQLMSTYLYKKLSTLPNRKCFRHITQQWEALPPTPCLMCVLASQVHT